MFYIVFSHIYLMRIYSILSFRVRLCSIRKEYLCQNALQQFHFLSNLVRSSSLPSMFVSPPIGKVQNLHPGRGKLKRTRNILKDFFPRAIKGMLSVVYRK